MLIWKRGSENSWDLVEFLIFLIVNIFNHGITRFAYDNLKISTVQYYDSVFYYCFYLQSKVINAKWNEYINDLWNSIYLNVIYLN